MNWTLGEHGNSTHFIKLITDVHKSITLEFKYEYQYNMFSGADGGRTAV